MTDEELAAIHRALGDLIWEVRRQGPPHHIEGNAETCIHLVILGDEKPEGWS